MTNVSQKQRPNRAQRENFLSWDMVGILSCLLQEFSSYHWEYRGKGMVAGCGGREGQAYSEF